MLTGQATLNVAVDAFNQGFIDKFLLKSTPNLTNELLTIIRELERQYFCELSQSIFQNLNSDSNLLMFQNEYQNLLQSLISQYHIIEYYMLDHNGSQLLVDAEGNAYWFVLRIEDEMASLQLMIEDSMDVVSVDVANNIKNRKN